MDEQTSRPFDFPATTMESLKNLEAFLITSSEGHLNLPHQAVSNRGEKQAMAKAEIRNGRPRRRPRRSRRRARRVVRS
jgi:hypothetical protein